MIEILVLLLFPWAMAYAAASDLFTMTISNRISLALVAGFLVLAFANGMDWQTIGLHFAAAGIMLAVAFVFFAMGWIGGGDAKLAAAVALWLGWNQAFSYAVTSSILGGLLTLAILVLRSDYADRLVPEWSWVQRLRRRDAGVPYGIALAYTGLAMYPDTPWMQGLLTTLS
ncbi:MAG TPA: prepilin peptidase [Kaistiaceae bacterium]|nr:prepilin peptidase [Kaistiaceae bacterium]